MISEGTPDEQREVLRVQRLINEGRSVEAVRLANALLAGNPRHPEYLRVRSIAQFFTRDFHSAIEGLTIIVEMDQNDTDAWGKIGLCLAEAEKYEEAIQYFAIATELNPGDYVTWTEMGKSFVRLNNHPDAICAYTQATEANGRYAYAWRQMALSHEAMGNHHLAMNSFDRAVLEDPGSADAWVDRGCFLGRVGEGLCASSDESNRVLGVIFHRQSLRSFDEALTADPEHEIAKLNVASIMDIYGPRLRSLPALEVRLREPKVVS